ncbi:MAG TPA: hypothetical protein VFX04_06485 [Rhodanobacteraceae bacterium]|jgi:hypothetical protein|nr:hypothetical protein [Rhodanobacteraceae bacterium]
MLRVWHALTYIGDGAVLVPCSVLLFAWLIAAPATRRTGWFWLAAVLGVGGGVALSKLVYMVYGWHPAGLNFIGLSGHAALSLLFWPSLGALATARGRTGLRIAGVALGAVMALAVAASSWVVRDHSAPEIVLGALWGALVATIFLALTWRRHATEAPILRAWVIAGMLLVVVAAFGHEFPSRRVLGWIASQANGHTAIHTRSDLGPQARLSKKAVDRAEAGSHAASPPTPP